MGGRKHKKKQQNNKKSKNAQIKKNKNRNGGKPQSQKNAILQKLQTAQDITNTQLHEAHCNNNNNNDYNNHSNDYYNGGGRKNKKNKNKHQNNNNNRHNNKNKWKQKASYKSELNQFKDQLRPFGLGIRNARSDGNCLFRAISDQISGDENNQARFRKGIVEYMTTNSDEFAPFYVGDYVAYLKKMSKNGIWGGNMELTAAAKAFKVDIVIHSLNAARYEILYQKGKPERTIHLSYHNERHYASVRRLEDMRSVQPSRKINLDKSQVDKLQREQQRAEIAWCHSGGNPLDIESAKDKLLNLTPTEQVVVARTGCYDITKVKEALHFLDGDIDAAVESIMVDISLMANEQKEKTIQLLEKQKEEEEHEKDNNKPKKKKKKKHKHRKNKNKKKENNQNIGNKKEEKDEKKTEKKENDESKVNQQENMKKDEAEPIVPVVDLKSAVVHDEDLEQRLVKMKESVNKKERSLDDILSVKVKICKDDKKENNIAIKSDLDKKNQSDINNKDKKQEKQDKEDKDELLDIQFYQERDTRINAEKLKMKKIKCIDNKCNFQHELLLVYLKHYKFIHLQNGVIKNKLQSKKDIICPCGHKNQFDFQFCSKCGWDLRFKLVLPPHVQKQMKNVNEKIRKSQEQYAIGQVPANKLLNSTKSIVIHKKNNKSDKSNKSNKSGNYKWRKSPTLYNKYKKYMYRYWKCKKCTFVNPKSNQTCMVCSMCNSKPVQYNTKNIIKQSNDDYPALTSHKKHVNPSTNWVAMAIQKNKPKTKPKAIKQQKKNEFGWICSQCTFENKPSHQKCKMCSNNKPKKSRKNQQQKKNNNIQGWKCACTLINDCNVTICSACGNNKESMNGVTDTYYANPHYDFDESELKNEMDSYEKPWEKYKNKQKNNYKYNDGDDEREGDDNYNQCQNGNYNGNNGWSVKGNDKCRCGSGKKYKKCCKKLEKHTDKSYKNKYKNHEEYHHSYNHKKNDYEMDPIDELNKIIKVAERQIFDFKGKKQIKIQMIRELEKTKAKRNELMKKLDSNRNKAIKAQNRQRENNKNKKMNNNRVVISNGSNKKSNNSAANLTIAI